MQSVFSPQSSFSPLNIHSEKKRKKENTNQDSHITDGPDPDGLVVEMDLIDAKHEGETCSLWSNGTILGCCGSDNIE